MNIRMIAAIASVICITVGCLGARMTGECILDSGYQTTTSSTTTTTTTLVEWVPDNPEVTTTSTTTSTTTTTTTIAPGDGETTTTTTIEHFFPTPQGLGPASGGDSFSPSGGDLLGGAGVGGTYANVDKSALDRDKRVTIVNLKAGSTVGDVETKYDPDKFFITLLDDTSQCLTDCFAVYELTNPMDYDLRINSFDAVFYKNDKSSTPLSYKIEVERSRTERHPWANFTCSDPCVKECEEDPKTLVTIRDYETWDKYGNLVILPKYTYHNCTSCSAKCNWYTDDTENYFDPVNDTDVLKPGGRVKLRVSAVKPIKDRIDWMPILTLDNCSYSKGKSRDVIEADAIVVKQTKWSWWDTNWLTVVNWTITNNAPVVANNLSVKINVTNQVTWTKIFDNLSDVRFTYYNSTSDTETEASFFLYRHTVNANAVFIVKVPYFPASGSTIVRMYYNNPASYTIASSISNTALFFDDFTSLSSGKWLYSDWAGANCDTGAVAPLFQDGKCLSHTTSGASDDSQNIRSQAGIVSPTNGTLVLNRVIYPGRWFWQQISAERSTRDCDCSSDSCWTIYTWWSSAATDSNCRGSCTGGTETMGNMGTINVWYDSEYRAFYNRSNARTILSWTGVATATPTTKYTSGYEYTARTKWPRTFIGSNFFGVATHEQTNQAVMDYYYVFSYIAPEPTMTASGEVTADQCGYVATGDWTYSAGGTCKVTANYTKSSGNFRITSGTVEFDNAILRMPTGSSVSVFTGGILKLVNHAKVCGGSSCG